MVRGLRPCSSASLHAVRLGPRGERVHSKLQDTKRSQPRGTSICRWKPHCKHIWGSLSTNFLLLRWKGKTLVGYIFLANITLPMQAKAAKHSGASCLLPRLSCVTLWPFDRSDVKTFYYGTNFESGKLLLPLRD